jgi:hypothetical protein
VRQKVKLLRKTNHGQAGDVVSLQQETVKHLLEIGVAELHDESIVEEIVEDDGGDEPGEADISE